MTGEKESGTSAEVTIMVVMTAVQFACTFGIIAVLILGGLALWDGALTMRACAALLFSLILMLVTGYQAMMLIVHPTQSGVVRVALSALILILPIIILEL